MIARLIRTRLAIIGLLAAAFALLLGAAAATLTWANWTDEESTGAQLQAGIVPIPENVTCSFGGSTEVAGLIVNWGSPESGGNAVDPQGYQLRFFAGRSFTPEPINASVDVHPGETSYQNFEAHLRNPNARITNPIARHTYEIQLVTLGPGTWESEHWLLEVTIVDGLLGISDDATCRILDAPEGGGSGIGTDSFEDRMDEQEPEERDDAELLESPEPEAPTETAEPEPTPESPTTDLGTHSPTPAPETETPAGSETATPSETPSPAEPGDHTTRPAESTTVPRDPETAREPQAPEKTDTAEPSPTTEPSPTEETAEGT